MADRADWDAVTRARRHLAVAVRTKGAAAATPPSPTGCTLRSLYCIRAAAGLLRSRHGRDAVHVTEVGLRGAGDTQVTAAARAEGRAVVTENVADFAAERDLVLVFIPTKNLPAAGGQAAALARILDRWAEDNPGSYLGHHWPATD